AVEQPVVVQVPVQVAFEVPVQVALEVPVQVALEVAVEQGERVTRPDVDGHRRGVGRCGVGAVGDGWRCPQESGDRDTSERGGDLRRGVHGVLRPVVMNYQHAGAYSVVLL